MLTPWDAAQSLLQGASAAAAKSPACAPAAEQAKPLPSPFGRAGMPAAPHASAASLPAAAAGCVQTSSGRIARPTPKTAAQRAASDELSEASQAEGALLVDTWQHPAR